MNTEDVIRVGAAGVAGVELVVATAVQMVASAGIKTALKGQDLGGLGSLLSRAVEVGIIKPGPAEALGQVITGAGQQAADACEALKQSIGNSPLGDAVKITCENTFEAALKGLRTEMLNSSEHFLGGLRMAGVMGLASIFLSRRLTEEWGRVFIDNEFYAFIAAQGTLVLASALVNSLILAPISKLSLSSGEICRDVGVGFAMATVTVIGEVAARRLSTLEDVGPSVGAIGGLVFNGRGAISGAIKLISLLR